MVAPNERQGQGHPVSDHIRISFDLTVFIETDSKFGVFLLLFYIYPV
jgi:hypothetical protein